MLDILIKLIIFTFMPISGFFVGRNIIDCHEKILKTRNFICFFALCMFGYFLYDVEYQIAITLLNFSAIIIYYKSIFKLNFFDSFIVAIILMILMFISEIIVSLTILSFFSDIIMRVPGFSMLLGNVSVGCLTILLSKIKFFRRIFRNISSKFEKHTKIQSMILSFCWIATTSIICYFLFTSMTDNIGFLLGSVIQGCFIIFIVNFFRDKNNYIALNDKFETLYNYIEDMEEYLDSEKLNIHEYKNQLSVIRSMTKNKKILDYIDSIIKDVKIDTSWGNELKNLPKGGFKGLIYYKFLHANTKQLEATIDISKNCCAYFNQMSVAEIKELSRLIGIYLDNAIEAAEKSAKKIISLEIYKTKHVNIVISNSVEGELDIKKFSKKGYTSKGSGRGNGLYLAKKLVDKNPNVEASVNLVNQFYIQKLILK